MKYEFRQAKLSEIPQIWEILQAAIARRKADGSSQWQDGYPNPEVIEKDIEKGAGYVLANGHTIAGYVAILINDEPEYNNIKGKWITNSDFVVFHRIAVGEKYAGQGLAKHIMSCIEDFARSNSIYSIKADTNFDNAAMLKIFGSLGYTYCGEVYFRGSARRAYEKMLES